MKPESLSVIPFDTSDGLIPRYRQKYQARHRFYTSCLNYVFLVSYKNPVLLPAVDWTLHTGGKANHKNICMLNFIVCLTLNVTVGSYIVRNAMTYSTCLQSKFANAIRTGLSIA